MHRLLLLAAIAMTGCMGDDLKRQTPEEPVRWRAQPSLIMQSQNGGWTYREPFQIELDGNIVSTQAWSGRDLEHAAARTPQS
jgi:hypothetical protein